MEKLKLSQMPYSSAGDFMVVSQEIRKLSPR